MKGKEVGGGVGFGIWKEGKGSLPRYPRKYTHIQNFVLNYLIQNYSKPNYIAKKSENLSPKVYLTQWGLSIGVACTHWIKRRIAKAVVSAR